MSGPEAERELIFAVKNKEQVNRIKVEGFEAPEGTVAVVTPKKMMQEVVELLPPDFLHNLRAISHKNEPDENLNDNPDVEIKGSYVSIFDKKNNLVGVEIEIYRELFIPRGADEKERALIKRKFMGTMWHELGHNARHMMRFDEMNTWEKVLGKDQTPVTWYVQYARKIDEKQGEREDFSESFRLFITDPAILHTLSPGRYQFMIDCFDRRFKAEQRQVFNSHLTTQYVVASAVWKRSGYSRDEIRRLYLTHQENPD